MRMRQRIGIQCVGSLLVLTVSLAASACAALNRASGSRGSTVAADAATPASLLPRELNADEQAHHALDRLAFGARPGDVQRVRELGVDRWIAEQLRPDRIDDDIVNGMASALTAAYESPADAVQGLTAGVRGDTTARRQLRQRYAEAGRAVQSARLLRAVNSERQLQETLVDLWANHFSVFAGKGPVRLYLAQYENEAIRPHVLGKFRDLLGAVAHSPAMLFYLDNWQSAADSLHPTLADAQRRGPALAAAGRGRIRGRIARRGIATGRTPRGLNENYARELLELHTLGVDGGYSQQDVIEVARAFTGWSIAAPRDGGGFVFRAALHDAGAKVVLGQRIKAGGGESDGERVLDILSMHPATARMVATTIARRFVSDEPPASLIDRGTAAYMKTGGDLREVVRAIATSPEFFSRAAYRAKVKSPLELVASSYRAAGAAPDTTPRSARTVARLGQPLYGHQTPNGWPERGSEWLSAGAVADRVNFISMIVGRPEMSDSLRALLESPDFQRR